MRAKQSWFLNLSAALWLTACGGSTEEDAGASGTGGANADGTNADGTNADGTNAGGTNVAGAAGTSGSGGSTADASVHDPSAEIGVFSVQLVPPRAATATQDARAGSTDIIGSVGDKPVAQPIIWELQRVSGDCQLLVPRVPFCDPDCGREVCVEDDTCEPDRVSIDVGTIRVSGVTTTAGESEIELTSVRNAYQSGTTPLPFPAFEAGDAITLNARGAGATPAFSISARGIAPLEVPADAQYVLNDGEDLAISWTPSASEGARIQLLLDISHHGGAKGKIECKVEDNGAFTMSADMLTELKSLGVAGFPSIKITRTAEQSTPLPNGRVRMRIYQYDERAITIPGLVSCESPAQCEADQTCLDNKTCG